MLSYRHAFHAGNFADVLKHSVLTLVLEYMTRKEKGFYYIDSHSGAGMYSLVDEYAQKTAEYLNGINKIIHCDDLPQELEQYLSIIKQLNPNETLNIYPGSPALAKQLTRRQDSSHLFELHPTDNKLLNEFCQRWHKSHVQQSDGYQGILSLVPPPCRRAVILIDPPYELKTDYEIAVNTITKAYQKFATGCYILWYPVVKRQLVEKMQQLFLHSSLKNVLQVEYCQTPDSDEYGMTGTGLFIVNPPWQLQNQLSVILPFLKEKLGSEQSHYTLKQLIEE